MSKQGHTDARLLAIDDSELVHRLLRTRLQDRLEVISATCAIEGLEMARTVMPDVILLDIEMPGADGFEIIKQLKADPATHDIPVIFLSGSSDLTGKIKAFELGAVDFINKPFEVAELKARVSSALRMSRLIRMLAQRAQIDGLTGLWNRAYFNWRLSQEFAIAERHCNDLSLIICDIDFFKKLNDTHGHPFGDYVLERFADMLANGRKGDIACRYGGEEFGIILPETACEEAALVSERLLRDFRETVWKIDPELSITASFGVSDLLRIHPRTPEELVASADRALYQAKNTGRNKVIIRDDGHTTRLAS